MSCLSKKHRLKNSKDFNKLYKSGKKWHTHSFVAFFSPYENFHIAYVASKKVGNAIKRAKAKRVLRALCLENENKIQKGKYIFVAKEKLFEKSFEELKKDFNYAMKKLQLIKNENPN
ncbi:ribonuclease P protein component [Halarcobacter ebronensis]|uniref:Ribonuclease P protein component n=1 Tax=Halarcobacter ebronensis TaxID=1462615 RepID=A0A4Q0YL07_9BACT|nr:ribonuclease P protein component [Halarcobacter ebronensis]QKF82754.1 ribonuclease P, protein component [Halarcobacter ebronensis]RXJ69811.1 ribonuclease P protein component [Halarcobacter ebronensis]RXK06779.1 ribonuclease P protein component [Halarcobacter ebronensis]